MKETFIIIGEGPTEYFFLTSLKDEFRTLQNIDPKGLTYKVPCLSYPKIL